MTPKSEDKYVEKVFNWSEVHLSEMTCYKIHTLVEPDAQNLRLINGHIPTISSQFGLIYISQN